MNKSDDRLEFLTRDLPSPGAARRFFEQFRERNPGQVGRLLRSEGLLSDVLTLASYSPLLAATLLQFPEYIPWLAGKRLEASVQRKDDLLESLARFAMTHSAVEPHVLLARFRRRELLRIFLRDIRRMDTVAEITEELSNLADTILEYAVRLARQEMDNRYGPPFETGDKGRRKPSEVCIVSLGKLGSRELNYSSDIDLLFIYSADGNTTGTGSREGVTNREYFVRFAETVTKLVGQQTGEGAAYRVDMRLRPHGRVGSLALSLKETVRYYLKEARSWEQQVLIRSRPSAGDASLYKKFFSEVEESVFRKGRDPGQALHEVYLSKERIDRELASNSGFNVKLGIGGIREIEFIAQALQLAYGGEDSWLRTPHTLISISRLADRGRLTERERSGLSNAYDFLRRLEHILQMEYGLQTHSVPTDDKKVELLAAKMRTSGILEFQLALTEHTDAVHNAFLRVFGKGADAAIRPDQQPREVSGSARSITEPNHRSGMQLEQQILDSLETRPNRARLDESGSEMVRRISSASPQFAGMLASRPDLIEYLCEPSGDEALPDYHAEFASGVNIDGERSEILKQMRTVWSRMLIRIAAEDIYEKLPVDQVRRRQTLLAEASIFTAMTVAVRQYSAGGTEPLRPPAVFALGKLASGTLDYGSDLDIVMAFEELANAPTYPGGSEIYSRIVELFVTLLSSMTRDGNLYRVDLRLRPYGKSGPNITSLSTLLEYIEKAASIWELLAYIQARPIRVEAEDRSDLETTLRAAIARRAGREDPDQIKLEARTMRLRLESMRTPRRRDIDIKFGSGGLLDIYFVVRCLQLLHAASIEPEMRSTGDRLDTIHMAGLLGDNEYKALREGHRFLSTLDHNLRLAFGRSSKFPRSNHAVVEQIAVRMNLGSEDELVQNLAFHRINIREAFDHVFPNTGK